MKIETKIGNLLAVRRGHIVHGCNAQGVMGSGVALAVKNTYPAVYQDYLDNHIDHGLSLGQAYPVFVNDGLVVWNAITQDNFGYGKRQVSYDAVAECFKEINLCIAELTTIDQHVNIPLIGAARGGGNWEIIREIIEQTVEFPVTLWLPDSTVTTL